MSNPATMAPNILTDTVLPREHRAVRDSAIPTVIRVLRVPIFAETREADGREDRDETWLQKALDIATLRAKAGYRPPMHFDHHGTYPSADKAGWFEPNEIAQAEVNPNDVRAVLFADLLFPTDELYRRWRDEFPYRSVEISPDYPDEINSLALLSHEAPYFRFPIPRVAESFSSGGRNIKRIQYWRAPMATDEKDAKPGVPAPAALPPMAPPGDAAKDPFEEVLNKISMLQNQHGDILKQQSEIQKRVEKLEADYAAGQMAAKPPTPVVEVGHGTANKNPGGAPTVMSAEAARFSAQIAALEERIALDARERQADAMLAKASVVFSSARARVGGVAPSDAELAGLRDKFLRGGQPAFDAYMAAMGEVRTAPVAPVAAPKPAATTFAATGVVAPLPPAEGAAAPADDMPADLKDIVSKGGPRAEMAQVLWGQFKAGKLPLTRQDRLAALVDLPPLGREGTVLFNGRQPGQPRTRAPGAK